MKAFLITLLIPLTASLTGCISMNDWQTVRGSGNVTSEGRQVSDFDRVSVSGSGEVTLAQGDQESLTIETDDNLLPFIRSEVHDGHLSIGPRDANLRPTHTIRYRLSVKNIRQLHLSGSMRAQADSIKTDRLSLHISGAGKVEIAQLETEALHIQISGSGHTVAAGHAERQEISISGSGRHDAADLRSTRADVHISGSGDASLWVVGALNADISGSGRVEYRGDASVDSRVSGSGRVHHRSGE